MISLLDRGVVATMVEFMVRQIPAGQTYDWLVYKHYAARIPSISYAFGLYQDQVLIGVCTYGTPPSATLLRGVCGEKFKDLVIELNRLVCRNERNVASYFVARTFRLLPPPKIIVSYADASKGHIGYVYQACNFLYTGLSTLTYDPVIKGQEHKHHATSGVGRGLSIEQMQERFGEDVFWKPRARKHRYIYFVGDKRFRRDAMAALRYNIEEYPKGDGQTYDASYEPTTQGALI